MIKKRHVGAELLERSRDWLVSRAQLNAWRQQVRETSDYDAEEAALDVDDDEIAQRYLSLPPVSSPDHLLSS